VVKAWAARWAAEKSGQSIHETAAQQNMHADYFARLVRLGYLAPDIITAIVEGRQPAQLTRQKLARLTLPLEWQAQRQLLGFC
jgi:hypothetical protein